MRPVLCLAAALLALTSCTSPTSRPAPPPAALAAAPSSLPGRKADGSVLLPNQWSLRPAGKQVESAISRSMSPSILLANSPPSSIAAIVRMKSSSSISPRPKSFRRTNVHEAFYGLEFSKDGQPPFLQRRRRRVVHRFDFQEGILSHDQPIKLRDRRTRGVPAGLALDGKDPAFMGGQRLGQPRQPGRPEPLTRK